jgi:pyroglutamyl-peptidase
MTRILLTGFQPFDHDTINPSAEAVEALAGSPVAGADIVALILPTTYAGALPALRQAIARHRPDAVLSVGQAGGRPEMSVERVAINVDDARIADNAGVRRVDEPVIAGGPAAYFATVPIKAMVARMRAAGVPAHVSQSAGTFLCNHVFYGASHIAATQALAGGPAMRVGFIHVPFLPEQAARRGGVASLGLAQIVAGLRIAVETLCDGAADLLRVAEGAAH